jgi:hypothetical protein
LTLLFGDDIVGFTQLSKYVTSRSGGNSEWYLTAMTHFDHSNGGTVDRIMGVLFWRFMGHRKIAGLGQVRPTMERRCGCSVKWMAQGLLRKAGFAVGFTKVQRWWECLAAVNDRITRRLVPA